LGVELHEAIATQEGGVLNFSALYLNGYNLGDRGQMAVAFNFNFYVFDLRSDFSCGNIGRHFFLPPLILFFMG
jgi:hypothetical protein